MDAQVIRHGAVSIYPGEKSGKYPDGNQVGSNANSAMRRVPMRRPTRTALPGTLGVITDRETFLVLLKAFAARLDALALAGRALDEGGCWRMA